MSKVVAHCFNNVSMSCGGKGNRGVCGCGGCCGCEKDGGGGRDVRIRVEVCLRVGGGGGGLRRMVQQSLYALCRGKKGGRGVTTHRYGGKQEHARS